jgi:uncharacterized protein HemY
VRLVELLLLTGRMTEAEELLREAVWDGELEALIGVGMVIGAQPDRRRDAEQTFRLAALGEHPEASLMLGALLADEPGRHEDAAAAFRAAIDGGLDVGWCGLASLLSGDAQRAARAQCGLEWWPNDE